MTPAARGRPRSFDRGAALARAMETFWEHGYESTSMTALTSAMGINSPSLYAAFGSKEQLFREAVALYDATEGASVNRALTEEPTAHAAVATVLRENARAYTTAGRPSGCMIVLAATNCSEPNAAAQEYLAEWRRSGIEDLTRRLDQGVRDGELPAGTDASAVAHFYTAVLQGMSVQARDGASRADLERVADQAMTAWDAVTAQRRRSAPSPPPPTK
ncbi:TetR/AcrR family transcriptional regulator [Streptomyces gossypii]|uniref:TetR/AcrR family transcriptional regulator n=1 Tax=Streptomyces gossypii TaxID=2883101 RepID=UPI0035CD1CE4